MNRRSKIDYKHNTEKQNKHKRFFLIRQERSKKYLMYDERD